MKESTTKLAKATASFQEDLKKLSVDEINNIEVSEPEIEITMEMKCKQDGTRYIKPRRRLSPPIGKVPDKQKKEHERAWEYVIGMYQNIAVDGEPLRFSLCLYPGDADYEWEIPANVPVAVPRMVAKHLEEAQKYHNFAYLENASTHLQKDGFTHSFGVSGVNYRGKFRAIGAFA
jgi:hypothetical protein